MTARGLGLGKTLAGVVLVEEHLTLEVGGLYIVAVDECEVADTSARKEARRGGSCGPYANDGRMAAGEVLLSVLPDGREEHLARVALAVLDRVARRWFCDVFKRPRLYACRLVRH